MCAAVAGEGGTHCRRHTALRRCDRGLAQSLRRDGRAGVPQQRSLDLSVLSADDVGRALFRHGGGWASYAP